MENKRGAELSSLLPFLIAAVIVAVLVILAISGVFKGWLPWTQTTNNVQTIVTQCQAACATRTTYAFCSQNLTLKAEDLPSGVKSVENTCQFFSTDSNYYPKYGIAPCENLC